ncbi:4-hydroxyphenylacetate 3-monooxygenase, oxygenase component [Halomonas caseinilytica]|uniref:4-hydroxyphenylacetate 3-monooxygenase, oxygenase component n=1 Tax=Halomonas caseinilytica TaxID=438744 RepID=UPI0009F4A07A|nr:4-hydroxyphenylacetate 3-monooxygenase, oxygenase component [Halomonas caseinilytica]
MLFDSEKLGARKGEDVIRRLKQHPPNLWYRGKQVTNPCSTHPFKNSITTLSSLYDYQWKHPNIMLMNEGGRKVSKAFSVPKEKSDLKGLGKALIKSAQFSQGMLGREPAYLNRSVSCFSACSNFFDVGGSNFSSNVENLYKYIRDNDLSMTHTLINPRQNRRNDPNFQLDPTVAAHITKETDSGIYINGARLLATLPFADELAVFPSRLMSMSEASKNYAFAFIIPTSSSGLKFICRESVDYGLDKNNYPLSSRYEEMDAVVVFDNVFVPWERVLCHRDIDICRNFYDTTGATAHIAYQVVCKNIVKTEFYLGLVSLMIRGSDLDGFQHVHQKMAELWAGLQTMKAFKTASEAGARTNVFGMLVPDWDPLDAARFIFPRLYPRMVEIVQELGASGLVALPTKEDLQGPLREDIKKYFQSARLEAQDKIDLYRLAWDASLSAFAARQIQYERFFFGDPVQMSSRIFRNKSCSEAMHRVENFLRRDVQ